MSISRRTLIKNSALGAAVLAAPAIISRSSLASSGSINVFAWGDYIQDNMIKKFEGDTGIKINLSTYGSNEEAEQKLKAAGGKGFDVIFPSVTNVPNYTRAEGGSLLQPLDESKLKISSVIPSMYRDSSKLGAIYRGERYGLPFNWGTEAITLDSSIHKMSDADVSYGDLWASGLDGKVAFRQKSVLMGVAIYLDAIGKVPSNRAFDIYKTEADMRRVMDASSAYILKHKENFGVFWNNATEATNAFTQSGASIGQTWDTTGIKLGQDVDAKWKYRMPKEGGITWMDSMGIPAGAENVEQAYAFINAMLDPEMAGLFIKNTGYNSAAINADKFAGDAYAKSFNEIYNQDNLANLWWWQADSPWFSTVRQEFVDKISNA